MSADGNREADSNNYLISKTSSSKSSGFLVVWGCMTTPSTSLTNHLVGDWTSVCEVYLIFSCKSTKSPPFRQVRVSVFVIGWKFLKCKDTHL